MAKRKDIWKYYSKYNRPVEVNIITSHNKGNGMRIISNIFNVLFKKV